MGPDRRPFDIVSVSVGRSGIDLGIVAIEQIASKPFKQYTSSNRFVEVPVPTSHNGPIKPCPRSNLCVSSRLTAGIDSCTKRSDLVARMPATPHRLREVHLTAFNPPQRNTIDLESRSRNEVVICVGHPSCPPVCLHDFFALFFAPLPPLDLSPAAPAAPEVFFLPWPSSSRCPAR